MDYILTGTGKPSADGGFDLQIHMAPQQVVVVTPPAPVIPTNPARTITPSGGDDTKLVQAALDALPNGQALKCSGMFRISDTIWFDGQGKTLTGDLSKPSGFVALRAGMSGPYGALFCPRPTLSGSIISNLEFDAAGKMVELVFFDGGTDNTISSCYLHDIGSNGVGPPYGAMHSQNVVNLRVVGNRVERTGGIEGKEGVRGIWIVGQSVWIESNAVRDTGHTGIAIEAATGTVTSNLVERALVQGTGYKVSFRSSPKVGQPTIRFTKNTTQGGTAGAGLMLQDCANTPIVIDGNRFVGCGRQGTKFGAVYSSNAANDVQFSNNYLEGCKSLGGLLHATNWRFTDTAFVNTPSVLALESDCHQITLTRSGIADVGVNCSDVVVDGVRVA